MPHTGNFGTPQQLAGAPGTPGYGQVSVPTSATLIRAASAKRRSILIQNFDDTNDLFVGYDASVTTANAGHVLKPFGSVELYSTATVYGIRSAGSGNAGYLEEPN